MKKLQNPWGTTIGIDEHAVRRNKKRGHREFATIIIKRLNSNGSTDTTFGDNGVFTFNYPGEYQYPTTISVLDDGKIVFAGGLEDDSGDTSDFFVVRLTENGSIDSTFADDGLFVYDFLGDWDEVWGLKQLSSGKLLVGGYAYDGEKSSFGTVRLK